MNHLKLFFVNVLLATICTTFTHASSDQTHSHNVTAKISDADDTIILPDLHETNRSSSLRRSRRFRGNKRLPSSYTCNKFPRVCRVKGSAGPDCCNKKCVNVKEDRLNCGMCGQKCKYSEICCNGKCVNASFDKKHCGGCHNRCKKGDVCVFGMCSYAWVHVFRPTISNVIIFDRILVGPHYFCSNSKQSNIVFELVSGIENNYFLLFFL